MRLELIEGPLATVRLPVVRLEWLIETAVRPTVGLPNCSPPLVRPAPPALPAPAVAAASLAGGVASGPGTIRREAVPKGRELRPDAPPAKVNGNGSPVIQKGHNKGVAPLSKGRTYPAEILGPMEVQALLDALPATGPVGMRNRTLIVVLWRTGLRIQEALDLEPKDLDFDRLTVTVLRGKGSKRRTVAVDQRTLDWVARWLAYRQRVPGVQPWDPVFCTVAQNGRPAQAIGQPYARRMLKRAARKAGIRRRVHPHGLRHTLAAGLADEGVDLRVIQRQLGHSNVAVTARYVDHLTPGKALEVVQAREWPEGVS